MSETDGEDLVGTNGSVVRLTINHVVKAIRLLIPKEPIKTFTRLLCAISILLLPLCIAKPFGQLFHDAQRVVPERLNLYGQSTARRHNPITDFRIHPSQLHALFA